MILILMVLLAFGLSFALWLIYAWFQFCRWLAGGALGWALFAGPFVIGIIIYANIDTGTVAGFGQEWTAFDQKGLSKQEASEIFAKYFCLIDWSKRPHRVLDMGCGSGRWAKLVAPLVGELIAADASRDALQVARQNVTESNVSFIEATPDTLPFPDANFDLIFSLGVLHHLPDTAAAIESLAGKLCSGGSLLVYLYYAFDNRPWWYRLIWKVTDGVRRIISSLPFPLRYALSQVIAAFIYWPLARLAKYFPVPESWPLKFYAGRSFYVMRNDALDRFGTKLEKRFTKAEILGMMETAGLRDVRFSEKEPYWICCGIKP